LGVFGVIVLPTILLPLQTALKDQFDIVLPAQDLPILTGAIATFALTWFSWRHLGNGSSSEEKSSIPNPVEQHLGRFQVISACFVAFAHGSNDVGNAIAPLAAIAYIHRTGTVPTTGFSIPLWILLLGAIGIVAGLAVWGKKVIATIGEGIISLQPSSGFCAELATAATILLASRLGLPVSTSHALVGAVVGIGLIQSWQSVRWQTLQSIGLAWLTTLPITASLGAIIFLFIRLLPI
jgi:PiT family inorganic phosphate transporter